MRFGPSNKRKTPVTGVILTSLAIVFIFAAQGGSAPPPSLESDNNPYLAAATWEISKKATIVQRTAQLALQQFCRTVFHSRTTPPSRVYVDWKPSSRGDLANMELRLKGKEPPKDGSIGTLMRIDGIKSPENTTAPYSIYAFEPQEGEAIDWVSNDLIKNKAWEVAAIAEHIKQLDKFAEESGLSRSDVYFVDIGANIGTFTLAMAAAGFKVIAIEAMSINQFALSMSLCSNLMAESVTLLTLALSKGPGKCTVFSIKTNVLDGTIRCDREGKKQLQNSGSVKRQDVAVFRLDDVLKEMMPGLKGRVGSLKIDTEGLEPWVLDGATKFFTSVKPPFVQTEVSDTMTVQATKVTTAELLKKFWGFGYTQIRAFDKKIWLKPENVSAPNPTELFLYLDPKSQRS